jgi:hypothetical protein
MPIELAFDELIRNGPFDILLGCSNTGAELKYSPSAESKVGAFKKAQFGFVQKYSEPVPSRICLKKCIRWLSALDEPSTSTSPQRIMVYDNRKQAELLTTEMNCLRWAQALMGVVRDFLGHQIPLRGSPPIPVPQLAFVSASLAIGIEEPRETFLLENVIDIKTKGKFVKYISNNSAKPFVFPNDLERTQIGMFLAFCQHIQYQKTGQLAFVSDFQGSLSLNGCRPM